jgi:hypothetical protein
MNVLKQLSGLFASSARGGENAYWLTVRCNRCGEVVRARVNLYNDLSVEYDEQGKKTAYRCRKILTGGQRCFQSIEVMLTFDASRNLIDHQITGGTLVEE